MAQWKQQVILAFVLCSGALTFGAQETNTTQEAASLLRRLSASPYDRQLLADFAKAVVAVPDANDRARYVTVYCLDALATGDNDGGMRSKAYLAKYFPYSPYLQTLALDTLGDTCPACQGSGTVQGACSVCKGAGKCPACRGTGTVKRPGYSFNRFVENSDNCTACRGSGDCKQCQRTGKEEKTCIQCAGGGKVWSTSRIRDQYLEMLSVPSVSLPRAGNTLDISELTGTRAKPGSSERLIERIVTGVGTDPDKAVQAAFSQAIESTVGVLVDAETIVTNGQVIKDQVLAFSRGFVQKYDVVKQWEADGLHHATIKALVNADKLALNLRSNNIATHAVPGELLARQFGFDVKNEADATKMLRRILEDYDITKLSKVELVGKPDIDREGGNATMKVTVKISPDAVQYERFASNLRSLLGKVSMNRAGLACNQSGITKSFSAKQDLRTIRQQLGGDAESDLFSPGMGLLIGIAEDTETAGEVTHWRVYWAPEALKYVVKAVPSWRLYLTTIFLDIEGKQVIRNTQRVEHYYACVEETRASGWGTLSWWSVCPFVRSEMGWGGEYEAIVKTTVMTSLSLNELEKVAKVVVSLEAKEK
jgi:hypothetical protein